MSPKLSDVAEDVQRLKRLSRESFRELLDVRRRLKLVEAHTGLASPLAGATAGRSSWSTSQQGVRVSGRWTAGVESDGDTRRVTQELDVALDVPLRVSLGESLTVRATAPMDPVGVGGEPSGHLRLSRLSYRLRPTRNTRLTVVPCGAEGADAASTLNPAHGVALTRMGAAGSGVYRLAAACGEMGEPQEGWPRGGHEHDAAAIAFSSELRVPSSNIGVTLSGAHFWRRRGSRSEELDELHLRRSLLGQITLRPAPRLALAATAAVIDRSGSTKGMDHAAGASAAAVVGQSLVTLSAWAAKHSALGWEWALALAPSPPSGGASGPRWGGLIAQPWGASQPHVEAFLLMHTDAGDRGALTLTPGLVARRRQPVRAQLRAQLRF